MVWLHVSAPVWSAKGNCIKLFKIKVKAYIKYTLCMSELKNSVFVEKCSFALINVELC